MTGEVIKPQQLQQREAITDPSGRATNYFMQYVTARNGDITDMSNSLDAKADKTTQIIAGVGLSGGGTLAADVTLNLADTTVTPGAYGDSTHVATFTVDQQGRLTLAGQVAIGFSATKYAVAFDYEDKPTDVSQILWRHVLTDAFTIPANFASPTSRGVVGTNPTATWVLTVKQNGTTIGTLSVSTSGVWTLATTGGTSKSIAAGDVLTFVAPATVDATVAGISFTLRGT